MKVSNYLPNLYNKNLEMLNIIYSEEDELENRLKLYVDNAFKDNFPKVATESGIEKYEKLLNINLDENKDNLEYRRSRVLAKLTTTVPLTYRWLENNLINLVGKDNFYLEIDYNNYIITMSISNVYINTALTLYEVYRPLIPANMKIVINLFDETPGELYFGAISQTGEITYYESEVLV